MIDSSTGELTFSPAPDFENPTDAAASAALEHGHRRLFEARAVRAEPPPPYRLADAEARRTALDVPRRPRFVIGPAED